MSCVRHILFIGLASLFAACSQEFELNSTVDPNTWTDDRLNGEQAAGDDLPVESEEEDEPVEDPIDEEPPPEDDCEHTSDLIYVIDRDKKDLYLFDPVNQSFVFLGTLDCSNWGTPSSMGIQRDGYAYVRYSTGDLYQVSLDDLSCRETDYNQDFGAFGMGYATEHAGTWRDDLFIANKRSLAIVDAHTWEVTEVGPLPSQAELTGNSDGELWAFLPLESPPALVRLEKSNAGISEKISMKSFSTKDIDTFAFATWGGEFWLFVRNYGMGESTDVYRVTPDGHLEKTLDNVGLNIVGAGVSTCAPAE